MEQPSKIRCGSFKAAPQERDREERIEVKPFSPLLLGRVITLARNA
jgi:hypothetical protein